MDIRTAAIFFDLDDVLADYRQGFAIDYPNFKPDSAFSNRSHLLPGSGSAKKREAYELIKGTDFYARLPLMPGAVDLYAYCYEADPIILTAAPKFGSTEDDFHVNPHWLGAAFHKRNWVETMFLTKVSWSRVRDDQIRPPRKSRIPIPDHRFICTTSSRKYQFMHRKHSDYQILVDDRIDNITAWRDAGGTGILHTSAEQSLKELRDIFE